jgi:hypothetical protein
MTTMKKMTTCGRREMRALMQTREVNVAAPNARVRYTGLRGAKEQPIVDRSDARRKRRDHGTAAWNDILTVAARSMPRASRRALARLGQKVTTKRTRDLPRAMAKSVKDRVPTVSSQGKPGR